MQHQRPLMTAFDGLDSILERQFQKWMAQITPRTDWDPAVRSPNGDPGWWRELRKTLSKVFRQGADRASRRFERAQADKHMAALRARGVDITLGTVAQAGGMTLANLFRQYTETSSSGESAANLLRVVLAEYGCVLHQLQPESYFDQGYAELLRYVRYRFIPTDDFYSAWPTSNGRTDSADESSSRLYAPDDHWKDTFPPHPRFLWTIRGLVLRKVCIRPDAEIPHAVAWKEWIDTAHFAVERNWPAHDGRIDERSLITNLRPWVAPFAIGVFAMDPYRLKGDVLRSSSNVTK